MSYMLTVNYIAKLEKAISFIEKRIEEIREENISRAEILPVLSKIIHFFKSQIEEVKKTEEIFEEIEKDLGLKDIKPGDWDALWGKKKEEKCRDQQELFEEGLKDFCEKFGIEINKEEDRSDKNKQFGDALGKLYQKYCVDTFDMDRYWEEVIKLYEQYGFSGGKIGMNIGVYNSKKDEWSDVFGKRGIYWTSSEIKCAASNIRHEIQLKNQIKKKEIERLGEVMALIRKYLTDDLFPHGFVCEKSMQKGIRDFARCILDDFERMKDE